MIPRAQCLPMVRRGDSRHLFLPPPTFMEPRAAAWRPPTVSVPLARPTILTRVANFHQVMGTLRCMKYACEPGEGSNVLRVESSTVPSARECPAGIPEPCRAWSVFNAQILWLGPLRRFAKRMGNGGCILALINTSPLVGGAARATTRYEPPCGMSKQHSKRKAQLSIAQHMNTLLVWLSMAWYGFAWYDNTVLYGR